MELADSWLSEALWKLPCLDIYERLPVNVTLSLFLVPHKTTEMFSYEFGYEHDITVLLLI